MSNSRSRTNKSATTFWMLNDLKEQAQSKAAFIGITMTELINRAVSIYLTEGHKLDDEFGQKLTMAELVQDIKESKKYETQLKDSLQFQKGLIARLEKLELDMREITTGESLQSTINSHVRAHIQERIQPIMELIEKQLSGLIVQPVQGESKTNTEEELLEFQ